MEEKETSVPIPVRLTQTQLNQLDALKTKIGAPTRSDVIRWLISNARIRQASIQLPTPAVRSEEKEKVTA